MHTVQVPGPAGQLIPTYTAGNPFFLDDLTQAVGAGGNQLAARGAGSSSWSPQAISICDGTIRLRKLGISAWLYRQNASKYI
jgi:hypothetical protein